MAVDTTPTPAPRPADSKPAGRRLARRHGRVTGETIWETIIRFSGAFTILVVVLIFVFLLRDAFPLFKTHSLGEILTGRGWYPLDHKFGFLPLLVGSALVTAGAVIIAVPIGVASAIYVGEIAPKRVREFLKPAIELVAAVPSVVVGFIGLVALAPWLQRTLHMESGTVALTGSLMLAFMALPTIVSIAEDALATVPRDYGNGSLALGGTPWQTIWRVQLPAARSGIIAAIMLGIGRAIGETMTVLMVTGNAFAQLRVVDGKAVSVLPYTLFQSVRTMTATIAAEMGETVQYSPHYNALFMLGLALFLITFLINLVADVALQRASRR